MFHWKKFSLSIEICTLTTKRGVAWSEKTIENIFNNYFINTTKSLNIPVWNSEKKINKKIKTKINKKKTKQKQNTDLDKIWHLIYIYQTFARQWERKSKG